MIQERGVQIFNLANKKLTPYQIERINLGSVENKTIDVIQQAIRLEVIPDIIKNPDKIEYEGKTKQGLGLLNIQNDLMAQLIMLKKFVMAIVL